MNPHYRHSTSPRAMAASFWRHRQLVFQLTRREVVGRYRGSVAGLAWSFLNPLLMLVVYTVIFSGVFKARWTVGAQESKADFAIILFVGMIVHGFFAECVNRAPSLILSNVSLVKKVVFPLEILPWVTAFSALFHLAVSLCMLLMAQLLLNHQLPLTAVLFPVVLVPLALMTLGFTWLLAATGVFVRDIAQITGIFTSVLMFLSPVFYPLTSVPAKFRPIMQLNPLTFIIDASRGLLIFGEVPGWIGLAVSCVVGLACAWVGFWWFQKTRKGFADVL